MRRREFFYRTGLVAGGLMPGFRYSSALSTLFDSPHSGLKIRWQQGSSMKLFTAVTCDGRPLTGREELGILTGFCRLASEASGQSTQFNAKQPAAAHGPVCVSLRHELLNSHSGHGKDLLVGVLTLENRSTETQTVVTGFATTAQPTSDWSQQNLHIPLAQSIGHSGMGELSRIPNEKVDWALGNNDFTAHYREPLASDPGVRIPNALLLIPLVDIHHPEVRHRVSLMSGPEQARRFGTQLDTNGRRNWTVQTMVTLAPGEKLEDRGYLLIHGGDASASWDVFHHMVYPDPYPAIDWMDKARVHYYDYQSAADPDQPRGDGYEAAVENFREFHVGLGTQHAYYPAWGDFIQPDRPKWLAMPKDELGPVEMSFEKIRARIKATREAGAKAGIYMHLTMLDSGAREFDKLSDARMIDKEGNPVKYYWEGPDGKGVDWHMSIASPAWRDYLLQQAKWIMEIFEPDAIVLDETFAGLGYDWHPLRKGPLSGHAIEFLKSLRALVHSYGNDRALLTSDCGMAGFALWADGEAGDHAYPPLLGKEDYRREPVRYRSVLGRKPWLPCAWNYTKFWDEQMDLARKAKSGVALTGGWAEFTGLHRLPEEKRAKMLADIASLFTT